MIRGSKAQLQSGIEGFLILIQWICSSLVWLSVLANPVFMGQGSREETITNQN
jgi:hypothetical protein